MSTDFADTIRSTGIGNPASGVGTELNYDAGAATGNLLAYDRSASAHKALSLSGLNIKLNTNGSNAITIDSSQNVGIGTASPASKLDVAGNIRTTNGYIDLRGAAGANGLLRSHPTIAGIELGNLSNSPLWFVTNSTGRMRIDAAGNVGIGTSSPASKLDVAGNIRTTNGYIDLRGAAGATGLLRSHPTTAGIELGSLSNSPLWFVTNSTERMRIDATGKVGIGTTTPSNKLSVSGDADFSGIVGIGIASPLAKLHVVGTTLVVDTTSEPLFIQGSNGVGARIAIESTSTGGRRWDIGGTANGAGEGGGKFIIRDGTGDITRFTINSSGNVGIGTTSPLVQLHLIALDGVSTVIFSDCYGNLAGIVPAFNARRARGTAASPLSVANGDRLLTVGAIGRGSTGWSGNRAEFSAFASENWTDTAQGTSLIIYSTPNGTASPVGRITIAGNGNVGISTGSPSYTLDVNGTIHYTTLTASYDERFKKNIQPLTGMLDKLSRIRGIRFEWNETINNARDGYELGKPTLGLIAQEVEQEFPELVSQWRLNDEVPDAKSLSYDRLIPVLVEAIKELNTKLDALSAGMNS